MLGGSGLVRIRFQFVPEFPVVAVGGEMEGTAIHGLKGNIHDAIQKIHLVDLQLLSTGTFL